MSNIFIIQHRDPDFTGYFGAVDFYQGKGSTSSVEDAGKLLLQGCTIEDEAARTIVKSHLFARAKSREEIEAMHRAEDAINRNPGDPFTPERQAEREYRQREREAAAKAANTGGGQRRRVKAAALATLNRSKT